MTSVARTLQAVRPHIPSIKFPPRGAMEVNAGNGVAGSMVQSSPQPSNPSMPSRSPISSSSLETVPSKYRRKPISLEEMEYIERGGPE